MLKTIVIGNERPVLETVLRSLSGIPVDIQVAASFSTVKESINRLSHYPDADIIFSEIKLPDGLSFEIFGQLNINMPVIFVAGYDEFMLNALQYIQFNYAGYLPDGKNNNGREKTDSEYRSVEKLFVASNNSLKALLDHANAKKKERLQVRKGIENVLLHLQDIVLIYTENKVVFVMDHSGRKYLTDKTLGDLEQQLDNNMFFRANRQYIVNINYVKGFKAYEKVKLVVNLELPAIPDHNIIVSQKTAPAFRKWVYDA